MDIGEEIEEFEVIPLESPVEAPEPVTVPVPATPERELEPV